NIGPSVVVAYVLEYRPAGSLEAIPEEEIREERFFGGGEVFKHRRRKHVFESRGKHAQILLVYHRMTGSSRRMAVWTAAAEPGHAFQLPDGWAQAETFESKKERRLGGAVFLARVMLFARPSLKSRFYYARLREARRVASTPSGNDVSGACE